MSFQKSNFPSHFWTTIFSCKIYVFWIKKYVNMCIHCWETIWWSFCQNGSKNNNACRSAKLFANSNNTHLSFKLVTPSSGLVCHFFSQLYNTFTMSLMSFRIYFLSVIVYCGHICTLRPPSGVTICKFISRL